MTVVEVPAAVESNCGGWVGCDELFENNYYHQFQYHSSSVEMSGSGVIGSLDLQ